MRANYDFPYPVLKNDLSSSYSNQCTFEILDAGEATFANNEFVIYIQVSLQCHTLEVLIKNEICSVYIGYCTDTFRKMIKIDNINDIFELKVPVGILKSVDTINVFSNIICEQDFNLEYNDEMDPIFEGYNLISITKKDILALSNSIDYFYNRSGETIIQFKEVNEENFKDFRVDLSAENYITVQISHSFNEGYTRLKQDNRFNGGLSILNASLVHLIIVHTLSSLVSDGFESHIEKRWFKILVQVFSSKNIDIKKELSDMNGKVDIEKVFDFTQLFMNNYLEKSIVLAGKEAS